MPKASSSFFAQSLEETLVHWVPRLHEAGLSKEDMGRFAMASGDSCTFELIAWAMLIHAQDPKVQGAPFELLVTAVDASPYGLREWLGAICRVYEWLRQRERTSPFARVVRYLDCACQVLPVGLPSVPLLVYAEQMLGAHGFED